MESISSDFETELTGKFPDLHGIMKDLEAGENPVWRLMDEYDVDFDPSKPNEPEPQQTTQITNVHTTNIYIHKHRPQPQRPEASLRKPTRQKLAPKAVNTAGLDKKIEDLEQKLSEAEK